MKNNKFLTNTVIVSSTTILSRALGFLRDVTFFTFFGVSEIGSAFLLAFGIPNLFRKLLGEGALTSAIVPVLAAHYTKYGKLSMLRLFSHVFFRLLAVLLCILLCFCGVAILVNRNINDIKWRLAVFFFAILFPYTVFICLAAIVSAALNILGKFFIASINQVWMNISMIVFMAVGGVIMKCNQTALMNCLLAGVLFGGTLQLIIPLLDLFSCGWRPCLTSDVPELKQSLKSIWRLFLPGVFGAAAEQLNLLITRMIAYGFHSSAVSLLYLASRLVEFPVGIFGYAIITVSFPGLAKIIGTQGGHKKISRLFSNSMSAIFWILIPSAIGIFVLRQEIVSVLFQRGNFSSSDVMRVLPILSIYCISLVFSGVLALLVRGFHAVKDTKTPMFVGFLVLCTNVMCALLLIKPFGVSGLAAASTIACITQATTLAIFLKRKLPWISFLPDKNQYFPIVSGSLCVCATAYLAKTVFWYLFPTPGQLEKLVMILCAATMSLMIYLAITKKLVTAALFSKTKETTQ